MKLSLPAVLRAVEAFNHIGHMLVTRDTQRRVENLEQTVRYLKLAVNRHYGHAPLWTRDRRYVVGRKEFDDLYNTVGNLSAQLHNLNEAHNRVSSEVGILRNQFCWDARCVLGPPSGEVPHLIAAIGSGRAEHNMQAEKRRRDGR